MPRKFIYDNNHKIRYAKDDRDGIIRLSNNNKTLWIVKGDEYNVLNKSFGSGGKFIKRINKNDKRLEGLSKEKKEAILKLTSKNFKESLEKLNIKLFVYIWPDYKLEAFTTLNANRDMSDWYQEEPYKMLSTIKNNDNFVLFAIPLNTVSKKFYLDFYYLNYHSKHNNYHPGLEIFKKYFRYTKHGDYIEFKI